MVVSKTKIPSSTSVSPLSLSSLSPPRLGPASRSGRRIGESSPVVSSSTFYPPPPSSDRSLTHRHPSLLDLPNTSAQVSSYVPDLASPLHLSNSVPQIATAFIHLLSPGFEALGSPCLGGEWTQYVNLFPSIFWTGSPHLHRPPTALALCNFNGRRLLPLLC